MDGIKSYYYLINFRKEIINNGVPEHGRALTGIDKERSYRSQFLRLERGVMSGKNLAAIDSLNS